MTFTHENIIIFSHVNIAELSTSRRMVFEEMDSWIKERLLGTGSFGIVTLWKNSNRNQRLGNFEEFILHLKMKNFIGVIDVWSASTRFYASESFG